MALYVVTGGYGFIGRALVSQLKSDGHRVVVASRAQSYDQGYVDVDWVEFSFKDRSTISNIIDIQPDGVFHLAWSSTPGMAESDPASDISTNLAGTVSLLEGLTCLPRLPIVLVSSGGAIYGRTEVERISETHPLNPISVYGMTKFAMERYALCCERMRALDIRIARISNPFGVQQAKARLQGAATIFARKIVRGEKIDVWGDGSVVRDYVDVEDVAAGLATIMSFDAAVLDGCPIFNVGSGQGLSLLGLIAHLQAVAGMEANLVFSERRVFDAPANVLDVRKLRNASDWRPRDVHDRLSSLISTLLENSSS